ncbi:MAG: DNA mismatch repair protein MutS [Spirochaetia bacterium]|jgi:energy-coupling factor transporter ATP-binding protein EcfA2|nr:DNA mismatch repair protein MutS [Spirochaetia bacterium]
MFCSLLFLTRQQYDQPRRTDMPDYFKDLNLDQIFEPILKSKQRFKLEEFFFTVLHDPAIIAYRQEIMQEMENIDLQVLLSEFSKTIYGLGYYMEILRKELSKTDVHSSYLDKGHMLDTADEYCHIVSALSQKLSSITIHSQGLCHFTEYLSAYESSEPYMQLKTQVKKLRKELSTVHYCMLIKNGTIRVRKYENQSDHSKQILSIFEKFRQGNVKDYRQTFTEEPSAVHVETAVLDLVARLYKDIFTDLDGFCSTFLHFDDKILLRFSRELQFYLVWLEAIRPLRKAGLSFNYPAICDTPDCIYNQGGFDLALAFSLEGKTITNDFSLHTPEHILVITGPNQGGKTTFARAFGQLHHLASLGLCVPGEKAATYLFDNIFTHFGKEEDISTLNGKLQDDLIRLHDLLGKTTSKSIIIANEIFSSTTLSDALYLGKQMMDAFASSGSLAVVVTFLDELAYHGTDTVSMMSTVQQDNPEQRTYKIIRKPPDGLAYALYIAEKHGLTYKQLNKRLKK